MNIKQPLHHSLTFKPVTIENCKLIHQWLAQDHIKAWIHGEGLKNTLEGLDKFIDYFEKNRVIDRQLELTQHWLGYYNDSPIVYLMTTNVLNGETSIYFQHKKNAGLAITLDIFIGDTNYLGRGLAPQIITTFLKTHFGDISEVFIDPEKNNQRAIHVYQKTGFQLIDQFIAPWHPVPHYLMRLELDKI